MVNAPPLVYDESLPPLSTLKTKVKLISESLRPVSSISLIVPSGANVATAFWNESWLPLEIRREFSSRIRPETVVAMPSQLFSSWAAVEPTVYSRLNVVPSWLVPISAIVLVAVRLAAPVKMPDSNRPFTKPLAPSDMVRERTVPF